MGNAVLDKPLGFSADLSGGDGLFVVADLSGETSGYLSFSLTVEKPCSAILCWGEHLSDLRIRSSVEGRNFASELALKAGKTPWTNIFAAWGADISDYTWKGERLR
ncbi:MAG: hypothetical protein ACLR06_02170 [Christensenellaceae bacterium]